MTRALMIFLAILSGGTVSAGTPAIPSAWQPIQIELTTALRQAFRAMDAVDFDEPLHRRRVCELLWSLDLAANRQSPRFWTDSSPVVTGAMKRALDDEANLDGARARRIADFMSGVVKDAQLKPGTIWTEISAPDFAQRRLLLRVIRTISALTFGGLAVSTIYDHDWAMTGLIALIGVAATVGSAEGVLDPRNQIRPALLECEARLWRRVGRASDGASDAEPRPSLSPQGV